MAQLFANNAESTLASSIANVATSLTVATGEGARFPSPSGGDYFLLTLFNVVSGNEQGWEIVKCTARSGDVLTIVRGQEGTTGAAFSSGAYCSLRVTAGTLNAIPGVSSPVFYAYQNSAQTLAAAWTKINLQAERYDSASCFDTTTYKFTPNVAGYYQISGTISSNSGGQLSIAAYKNGSFEVSGDNTLNTAGATVSGLVYMNGSTDYIELYGYGSGSALLAGASTTFMCGFLARAA